MEWWQPIALGAGIALLAGPLTELFRSYFTRKHGQEERRRSFQRDTLLSLQEHLTNVQMCNESDEIQSASLGKRLGYANNWQCFLASFIEITRYRVLVDDEQVRQLAHEALQHLAETNWGTSEAEQDTEAELKQADRVRRLNDRIGVIIRGP